MLTGDHKATDTTSAGRATQSLLAPIPQPLILACLLQAVSAAARVVPFIAVAEIGRVLLGDAPDPTTVWWIVGIASLALALRLVCLMSAGALTHLADVDLQLHLRRQMARHLTRVPLGWFDARSAGLVKSALQDDVAALHHLVGHAYTNMVSAIVTPLVALAYLIWIDWRLTLVALVPVLTGVALYALQYRGYGEKMEGYTRELAAVNVAAVEFVQGIAVIKTFGQAKQAYGRFVKRTRAFMQSFWDWVSGLLGVSAAAEVVLSPLAALTITLAGGLALVAAGIVAPTDVLAFAVLAPALTAPFLLLSFSQQEMMLAKEAAQRIVGLLQTPSLPQAPVPQAPADAHVVFEGVSFAYDGGPEILHGIDLTLAPGTQPSWSASASPPRPGR
ncbi:MAG: ABC transporter ATP-binding protein [Pseudomonadota bacterium]